MESILDPFVAFWLPFYCEVKLVLLLYLVAPAESYTRFSKQRWIRLLVLLRAKLGVGVGDSDGQLLGTLNKGFPLLGRHTMSYFSTETFVLHHQHLELLQVVN